MAFSKRNIVILGTFTALAVLAGSIVLGLHPNLIRGVLSIKDTVCAWCSINPAYLFLAIVFLPGLGFPASPLLILAGLVWGSTWQTCALTILAVALNMTWTYYLAHGPASSIVTRFLGTRWHRWKDIHPHNLRRFTVLLRITPGIPFFLQNYILGLLHVPFLPYILISVPLNGIWVVGFVLTGGAIFEGNMGMVAAGLTILVAAGFGLRLLRIKLKSSRKTESIS